VALNIVDPYGGLRESWTVEVLNAASQEAGIVFEKPVIRQAPAVNQISLPTVAHYESCGPTAMAICAYAVGYIDAPAVNAVSACDWLGAEQIARSGTGTQQLLSWARNQGWAVHEDDRAAGDLDADLRAKGLIGISALDTAYGTGNLWNTLHPQAGGRIGHWEVFGAVDAPAQEVDAMTMDEARLVSYGFLALALHEDAGTQDIGAQIEAFAAGMVGNVEGGMSTLVAAVEKDDRYIWNQIAAIKAKVGM
jgi:hypothetical protein